MKTLKQEVDAQLRKLPREAVKARVAALRQRERKRLREYREKQRTSKR